MNAFPANIRARGGRLFYRFRIANLEKSIPLPAFNDPAFPDAYRAAAKSGVIRPKRMRPKEVPTWLWSLAREARKRCSKRGIQFELSDGDLITLLRRSNGQCEVSGLLFRHEKREGSLYRPFAPSIDRIDASQGYSANNVRLVCVMVNAALNQWGEGPFWAMIESACGKLSETLWEKP